MSRADILAAIRQGLRDIDTRQLTDADLLVLLDGIETATARTRGPELTLIPGGVS